MKQYKLTGWPDVPRRFRKTALRRAMSELSQRFATARDLARTSGASLREVEALIAHLGRAGLLMTRDAPQAVAAQPAWRDWWPVAAAINAVRAWR